MTRAAIPPVAGHEREREALARALDEGRLPQSLLLHGPAGVGKQRVALWLGQLLVCESPTPTGPCGVCRGCALAQRLEHPDVHWFFPLPRPRGASGSRLAAALEDARAERLATFRAEPLAPRDSGEVAGIYLAQVQQMRRVTSARPAMARRRVLIVGRAHAMVPQEASDEAANAFLKLLEEPPPDSHVVITTATPDALLPTIRSRVVAVRLGPLHTDAAASFLREHAGVEGEDAEIYARLGDGSLGRALELRARAEAEEEDPRERAARLVDAALADEETPLWAAALAMPVSGSRGDFADTLALLADWFRDLAALASAGDEAVLNVDRLDRVRAWARRAPRAAERANAAVEAVDRALDATRRNADPQLVTLELLDELRRAVR